MSSSSTEWASEYLSRKRIQREETKAWEEASRAQSYVQVAKDPASMVGYYQNDPTKHPREPFSPEKMEREHRQAMGVQEVFSPEKMEREHREAAFMAQPGVAQRRTEFVDAYEEAYYSNREEIDHTWYMQFTPQELRAFGAAPLARQLETMQAAEAYELELQADIEAEFQRRLDANDRSRSWWQNALAVGAGLGGSATGVPGVKIFQEVQGSFEAPEVDESELYRRVELEMRGRGDELYEDEIERYIDFERGYLNMLREGVSGEGARPDVDAPVQPGMEFDIGSYHDFQGVIAEALEKAGVDDVMALSDEEVDELLQNRESAIRSSLRANPQFDEILYPGSGTGFVEGGFQALGQVLEKGIDIGAWLWLEQPLSKLDPTRHGVRSYLASRSEQRRDETIAEVEREMGTPPLEVMTRFLHADVSKAWEEVEQTEPEIFDEYMKMGGFDPTVAFSFFQADIQTQISPGEQLEYMTELRNQEEERVEQLKDSDFRVSDEVLDVLAMYGRNVPGRLSTMFTLLLTDEDFHNTDVTENWIGFWKELNEQSELAGHMPSRALGIDGSVAGLVLDLGSGIAFDPTTWIFGPRLAGARMAKAGSAAIAKSQAKSALVRQMGDDIIQHALSPSRSGGALWHVASWLDSGSLGELLNLTGMNRQLLKHTPWKKTKNAQEVTTPFLTKLVPDGEIVDDLRHLSDDIIENGFQEPVVVHVSRADDAAWIEDGVKRVQAADQAGISHVPVTLKYVDDVPAGKVSVPGYSNEVVAQMQRLADFEGPGVTYTDDALEAFRSVADEADATLGSFTHEGTSYTLKYTDAPTEGRPAAGGLPGVSGRTRPTWYVVDEAGEIVGGYSPDAAIQSNVSGLMHSALEASEEAGQSFLPVLMNRADEGAAFSADGARFLRNAVDQRLGRAVPQGRHTGINLNEFLKTGEELGKPRKTVRPFRRNPDETLRPDAVLPKRLVVGDIDFEQVQQILERAILERGSTPTGAVYGAVARNQTERIKKLVRSNGMGQWLERYVTPHYVGKHFQLTGASAMDDILETVARVWGSDSAKMDEWIEAFMRHHMDEVQRSGEAARQLSELQPRLQRFRSLRDEVGGDLYDETLKSIRQGGQINVGAKDPLIRQLVAEEKALRRAMVEIDNQHGVVGSTQKTNQLLQDMWEDYNRTYIATNPAWKDVVGEDGLVPWDALNKGKPKSKQAGLVDEAEAARVLSDDMLQTAEELGVDAEELMQRLSHSQNALLTSEVPVSPLDMILASELGATAYTRASHTSVISQIREAAHTFHRMWIVDKVFTVSTAATVSFDELLRIFHMGGNKAFVRWMADKGIAGEARVNALLRGKGINKTRGAEHLSTKKQARLQTLEDYTNKYRQAERQMLEQHGMGWQDIRPGEAGFDDAARAWSGGLIQDSGFRAFLKGEDEFREWFLGPDGERLRRGTVVKNEKGTFETALVDSADEHYRGWQSVFEVILDPARKAGKYDEVLEAWRETARQVEASGGQPHNVPDLVVNHMGPVRGIKKDLPNRMGVKGMTEGFFDKLFMDPVNYRRGFLADLTRTHEAARLRSLFESQGKRIVSDAELETILGLRGLGGASRSGLREAIYDMALKEGVVPQGYIDNLVERAVAKEIENTLYAFDVSSRLGAQSRVAFPFGKPWADMAGFWGREVMRKPALRGSINKSNALWLRSANEKGLLSFPLVPNRTSAMVSRLAHTDFEIDQGLLGDLGTEERPLFGQTFGDPQGALHSGGILPGSTQSDFSPLLFLPTGGENPFSSLIPGLGIVPIAFLDYVVNNKYDPVEQPEEYQNLINEVGDFIPSVHFQQGGFLSRLLGGGTTARVFGSAMDVVGGITGDSFFSFTSEMGDISREIDRTREISALLADPAELELLMSAESVEEANLLLEGLANEADKRASMSHLGETVFRYMAPVAQQFSAELQEIENVWLDAATFPELDLLEGRDPEAMTQEDRRQVAADIRTAFFDLEPWKRDLMVVEQPSLAVNLVGSWEWTSSAIDDNIDGSTHSYRTGGTPADLARHQFFVRKGYVRPVNPIERARRIIGVMHSAKTSAAKELYTSQVGHINDLLWTTVPDETKADLEWVLDTDFAKDWGLATVEEVWSNWRTIEEDLEIWLAEEEGIEPVRGPSTRKDDLTEFDLLRRRVAIDSDDKPWGSTFPGLEEEDVSNRFDDWQVGWFDGQVDAKAKQIAETLGIDLDLGMTGEEVFAQVQQILVSDNKAWDAARPSYEKYIGSRSINAGTNKLYEMAQSDEIGEEHQERIQQFMFEDSLMQQRRKEDAKTGVTQADRNKMVDEFASLMMQAGEDWEWIWEEQYESRYGPLDWTPPEPVSPFDEDGMVHGDVTIPYLKHVVDGDTIMIQEHRGSGVLNSVRLLGIRADEITGTSKDAALEQEDQLRDALLQARENGDNIYLVRDPRFGMTDKYGRMLAWLWIGDTPYYNPEDLVSTQDPSGGDQ